MEGHPLQLRRQRCEGCFRPRHKIRPRYLLFRRPLGLQAPANLIAGPAAPAQPLPLQSPGAGDADNGVEERLRPRLKQERDDDCAARPSGSAPSQRLGLPGGADAGMQNGFQVRASRGVGESHLRQCSAIKPPARGQNRRAESFGQFRPKRSGPAPSIGARSGPCPSLRRRAGGARGRRWICPCRRRR